MAAITKNTFTISIIAAVFCTVVACNNDGSSGDGKGGGNVPNQKLAPGIEADGTCSQSTIDAYNGIRDSMISYSSSPDRKYLESAQKSCEDFKALVQDKSCKASSVSTGAATTVNKYTVESACAKVEELLNPPIISEDETPIVSLKKGFSLLVKDAVAINESLNGNGSIYIQAGRIIKDSIYLNNYVPYCYFYKKNNAEVVVSVGDSVDLSNTTVSSGKYLHISTVDGAIFGVCDKAHDETSWVVLDLKNTFKSFAEIHINK